jgi:dihydrofolate synthase / folylpolyglutamate synthase
MSPSLADALLYLDAHVNFETAPMRRALPTLDRIRDVCRLLAEPQEAYPVVHLTGTNGKGSTARMTTALLAAHGLSVGTYTSPHLERINERLVWDGEPIDDDTLAGALLGLEPLEEYLGVRLTHFEVLTAAALRWFADVAVDVAVLEVGLGGRWDATNVADATVAVVTNVGLDHVEVIGPNRADIAAEKAGIVKPGCTLVLGETDPALTPIFEGRGADAVWLRDRDFGCERNQVAVGGRVVDLRTPSGVTEDLLVPLRGPHQGDNAACSLAAAEAFFGRPLDRDVVAEAFASVTVPGRFEIVHRRPLVVLDGAHNPDGARALRATLEDDFGGRAPDVLVVGFTGGRDPREMLEAMGAGQSRVVVATKPPSPRGVDPAAVAAAAEAMGLRAEVVPSVAAAVERALAAAGDDEFVLVTGSLHAVGEARSVLTRSPA